MKNKLDNFLLSTLWLLTSTLGVCFWFNIRFGFNIFSRAHWHHLAYMQANQTPIATSFYISIIASIFIVIFGLHLLLRPRTRATNLPAPENMAQPTPHITKPTTPTPKPAPTPPEMNMARPARLNVTPAPVATNIPSAPITPVAPLTPPAPQTGDWPELREIFESAGYTIKRAPKIGTVQTALLAIGTGEQLWLGAVGITTTELRGAVDTMAGVFSDTLDDIYININAFVISAPDANAPGAPDILTFDSATTLRNYINEHKNTPPDADEAEGFEAFSSYISTVVDYLGKI